MELKEGVQDMKYSDEIYIGESVKDLGTVFYALKHKIPLLSIYCLCESPHSSFSLEILSARELIKPRNDRKEYTVIGIAGGKQEAFELFRFLVEEKVNQERKEQDL